MRPLLPLALFFIAVAWIASLGGDFPLNDDWSYGETTRVFLTTGKLYMPAACAAGFAHVFWGALFAKVFGLSYVALRISSVVAGAIGAFFAYLAAVELGLHKRTSLFCALLYAANPILVNLYLGFMSDVTALGLSAAFFYFFLRGIKTLSFKHLAAALLCLVLAISIRQSTVVLVAAAPAVMFSRVGSLRNRCAWTAAFLLLPFLTFWGADAWLMARETTGQSIVDHYSAARTGHSSYLKGFVQTPVEQLLKSCAAFGVVLCYQGLFTAPLSLAALVALSLRLLRDKKAAGRSAKAILPAGIIALLIVLISAIYEIREQNALMPFCENILRITSVGAQGIMGIANPLLTPRQKMRLTIVAYIFAFFALTQLTALFILCIKHLAAMSKSVKSLSLSSLAERIGRIVPANAYVVLATCLSTLGFLMVETIVRCTDRYYMIALLPVILSMAFLAQAARLRVASLAGFVVLLLFVGYSLCAGQDYMASNAARWAALNKLESQGIKYTSIDGGAEYNVVRDINVYASHYRGKPPRDTWRWWPIHGEEYIVSFSPIPEYDEKWHETYFSLLTMSKHPVFVLKSGIKAP